MHLIYDEERGSVTSRSQSLDKHMKKYKLDETISEDIKLFDDIETNDLPKVLSKVSGAIKRTGFSARGSFEVLSRCVIKNRPMVKAQATRTIDQFLELEREFAKSTQIVGEISFHLETTLGEIEENDNMND